MLKTGTGMQFWPLSTGTSDVPALVPGSPLEFNLSTIPINQGRMAYYLHGLVLTFSGVITNAGGTGVAIMQQAILNVLIDSMELRNCFHGTPISPSFVKGYWLPTISFIGGGYNYGTRNYGQTNSTNGAWAVNFSLYLPLSMGNGARPYHTAQLALFYRQAIFKLQAQVGSVLTTISPGSTFSTPFTVRCSAALLPRPEISVGPGVEWVDYQTSATSGQTDVQLKSFGNVTQLLNSESGAGVAFAMAMGNAAGVLPACYQQPGAFDPKNVTQIQIPWRGQINTTHIAPLVVQQLMSQGQARQLFSSLIVSTSGVSTDYSDWPHFPSAGFGSQTELVNLMGIPLVPQSTNVDLTKIQVVNGDTSYQLTLSSGPSGTHHTLVQHVRSWSKTFWDKAAEEIVRSGLAGAVYGSTTGLGWKMKTIGNKDPKKLSAKKLRFLPMVLKPS